MASPLRQNGGSRPADDDHRPTGPLPPGQALGLPAGSVAVPPWAALPGVPMPGPFPWPHNWPNQYSHARPPPPMLFAPHMGFHPLTGPPVLLQPLAGPPMGWHSPQLISQPPAPQQPLQQQHAAGSAAEAEQLPSDPWGVSSQDDQFPGSPPRSVAAQPQQGDTPRHSSPAAAKNTSNSPGQPGGHSIGPSLSSASQAASPSTSQAGVKLVPLPMRPAEGVRPPSYLCLNKNSLRQARSAALDRLQQLYPKLPGKVQAWLFHRLVAHYAHLTDQELGLCVITPNPVAAVPIADAMAACNTLAYAPAQQVADVAAALLAELRGRLLAGRALHKLTCRPLTARTGAKGLKSAFISEAVLCTAELEAQAMQVVLDPSLATPQLPDAEGAASLRSLPPPPAPAVRGAVVEPPSPLRELFSAEGGRKLLEQLLKDALASLPTATALAVDTSSSSSSGTGLAVGSSSERQQLPLAVSPDIDFGTVPVSRLTAGALMQAAASAASGLPEPSKGASVAAGAAAGSLLDLLHLSTAGNDQASPLAAPDPVSSAASNEAGGGFASSSGSGASGSTAPVLHFRQLVVENCGSSEEVWLLGGVSAPSFPHTLAAIDDARLFWLDGHKAVRLDARQQHTISVALSSADCLARRQEKGILQQLLLLVFAVPLDSKAAQALQSIQGVAVVDVPAGGLVNQVDPDAGDAAAAAGADVPEPATEAAVQIPILPGSGAKSTAGVQAAAAAPGFRLFVVARRVTVALIDRPADLAAQLLDVEAKPYIAEHLRRLFDEPPMELLHTLPQPSQQLLATGAYKPRNGEATLPPAFSQKGRALLDGSGLADAKSELPTRPLLRQHRRLLVLEEAAMEQDICRYDMFYVRLRLAVFSGSTTRYRLVHLTPPSPAPASEADQRWKGGLYRGPAVELLQPGGLPRAGKTGDTTYVLGVLDVPGLPEGRPALLLGDTVYLRTARQPHREIACLVAATEGSTCFLLLPPGFWAQADVAPLVPQLGASSRSLDASSGLFDGLMHVHFGFDRLALQRMQRAVSFMAKREYADDACWLPLEETAPTPPDPSLGPEAPCNHLANKYRWTRLLELQPAADDVAAAAAALRERGRQRLNAEQRHAVAAVVCGAGRAYPFALFGPPGTGKTVTLVECTLQILKAYPAARILLCAPQNYSADLLCSALAAAGLARAEMLRVNDPRRPPFTVKEDVLPFCQYSDTTRMFTLPEDVWARRVVVATCGAAALLREGAFAKRPVTFSHVAIDEAGQALLPEALIPLSLLAPPRGGPQPASAPGWGAVLCGDPRQLGPVVRSQVAASAGLVTSLLELCIDFHSSAALHIMKTGRVPATSMLVRNYRSHRRLLDLPSKLFYQGSLQAAADPRSVLPPRWRELQSEADAWQGSDGGSDSGDAAEGAPEAQPRAQQPAAGDGASVEPSKAAAGGAGVEAAVGQAAEGNQGAEQVAQPGAYEVAPGGGAAAEQEGQRGLEAEEFEAGAGHEEEGDGDDVGEEYGEAAEPRAASLLFYGVRGQQMREGDAPSYFNPLEASTVVELVSGLLGSGAGVQPDDIGVMATYRKQVQKIRLLLRQRGLGAIRVGTVDDYQGQEERIVFISTVLSKPESLPPAQPRQGQAAVGPGSGGAAGASGGMEEGAASAADVHLGFWRNPKRFNVAVTRAKALLVVVGHPAVLLEDASWRELLRYCFSQGAYRGAGADSLRQRFRVDPSLAAGALPELPAGEEGLPPEQEDQELQRAIGQLAELALLGAGAAGQLYPSTLDEMYESALDEAPFRVVL